MNIYPWVREIKLLAGGQEFTTESDERFEAEQHSLLMWWQGQVAWRVEGLESKVRGNPTAPHAL